MMLNRTISGSKTENSIIYNSVQEKKIPLLLLFSSSCLTSYLQSSHNVLSPSGHWLEFYQRHLENPNDWLTLHCLPVSILLTISKITFQKLSIVSPLMLLSEPKNVKSSIIYFFIRIRRLQVCTKPTKQLARLHKKLHKKTGRLGSEQQCDA